MVHPDIDYVVVESDATGATERLYLPRHGFRRTRRSWAKRVYIVRRLKGAELLGLSRTPVQLLPGHPGAHRVVEADFVTTTEGTGLAHNAGAFGEEDKLVTDALGIGPWFRSMPGAGSQRRWTTMPACTFSTPTC